MITKHKINLTTEQCDYIVVTELKQVFEEILQRDVVDLELRKAIYIVLKYYMSPSNFQEYMDKIDVN